MYPNDWHSYYGDKTLRSAGLILPSLLTRFRCSSFLEVGCGQAHWSLVAEREGMDVLAVDGPWNDVGQLKVSTAKYAVAELSTKLELGRRFDMAACLEVGEHLPRSAASTLVSSLTCASDVVVFGAAVPFQGGFGHINEQWPSYWRELFCAHGYMVFDLIRPVHWTDVRIHYWYRQNAFVYVNSSAIERLESAGLDETGQCLALFDAVLPEKFAQIASYEAISLRRLLPRLPGWTYRRLRSSLRAGVR